jgi:hypothetical protein
MQEDKMKNARSCKKPVPPQSDTDPDYEWWVFSTCIGTVELMLRCAKTDAFGVVPNPTRAEWKRAFHAPGRHYRWPKKEYGRVVVKWSSGAHKLVVC